jgi:hypothetical protein
MMTLSGQFQKLPGSIQFFIRFKHRVWQILEVSDQVRRWMWLELEVEPSIWPFTIKRNNPAISTRKTISNGIRKQL